MYLKIWSPAVPKDKKFEELLSPLKSYYAPAGLEVAERYKFHLRHQRVGETVREFLVDLRQLAARCNFGSFLDEALRDQLVVGLRDPAATKRLLTEKSLTFESAVKLVQDFELVQEQTRVLNNDNKSTSDSVFAVN